MPKIEIIIPAYNAAHYLPFALDSVIAQTFEDWRILLVDDGSTDDTAAVIAPYQEKLGDKLLYIRQANAGLPAARNAAIRQTSAEFLALLDADDMWLPNRLQDSLDSFADKPEVGLSYGYIARIGPDNEVIDQFTDGQRNGEGWIAPYIYGLALYLPCPTITFRKCCIDEVGGFDETMRATEDRDLWLRIALRYQVAAIPKLMAHYRISPQSMSADPTRMLKAQIQFVEKHYGAKGCGWLARQRAMSWVYKQYAEALARQRNFGEALGSALRSVAYYPFDSRQLRTAASLLLRAVGVRR